MRQLCDTFFTQVPSFKSYNDWCCRWNVPHIKSLSDAYSITPRNVPHTVVLYSKRLTGFTSLTRTSKSTSALDNAPHIHTNTFMLHYVCLRGLTLNWSGYKQQPLPRKSSTNPHTHTSLSVSYPREYKMCLIRYVELNTKTQFNVLKITQFEAIAE